MRRTPYHCLLILCLAFFTPASAALAQGHSAPTGGGEGRMLDVGDHVADLTVSGPLSESALDYLGVAEPEIRTEGEQEVTAFSLAQIKAKVLLVQIFSMYCPHCQREAPDMNMLHERLLDSKYKDDIKILGVGTGNTAFEVELFKQEYQIPFPLVPDMDFAFYSAFGRTGTPTYLLLKLDGAKPGDNLEIIYKRIGTFGDPNDFFLTLVGKLEKHTD